MKETIEKLKNNLAWYSELSCEEITALKKVGKENRQFLSLNGAWIDCSNEVFMANIRYRIKPDYVYKEKSEYVEYEITNVLGIYCYPGNCRKYVEISFALNDPGFAGVQFEEQEDKEVWSMMLRAFIHENRVTYFIDNGKENMKPATPCKIRFKK